jgi:hypothetical protein
MRKVIRFQVQDPSQVPAPYWSVDNAKIQAAIDAGTYQINGVSIWQEDNVSSRQS